MLFGKIFETHCAQILSCFGPKVGTWFIARSTFQLFFPSFFIALWIQLGLSHPLIAGIPRCMCTHLINVTNVYLLCCIHGNERTSTHDAICDVFTAIARDVNLHVQRNTTTCASFNHIPLILSMNWHIVHQIWNLHRNRCCHCRSNMSKFTLLILCNPRICCLQSS
jgi:hypothetical protein